MKKSGILSLFIVLGICFRCDSIPSGDEHPDPLRIDGISIVMDKDVYTIRQGDEIELYATYHNVDNKPYYLAWCSAYLEKLVDGKWVYAYGIVCKLTPGILVIPLKPDTEFTEYYPVSSSDFGWSERGPWNHELRELDGEYRYSKIIYPFWDRALYFEDRENYPKEVLSSNVFRITVSK